VMGRDSSRWMQTMAMPLAAPARARQRPPTRETLVTASLLARRAIS
jgi:hypothetical protein